MATTEATKAADNARRTTQRRDEAPADYWTQAIPSLIPGREQFRLFLQQDQIVAGRVPKPDQKPTERAPSAPGIPSVGSWISLDPYVEAIEWSDPADALVNGTLTFRRPVGAEPIIGANDRVILQSSPQGQNTYREVWRMRVSDPEYHLKDRSNQVHLDSDIVFLEASRDDFSYVKSKARPKGWLVHEVIRDVCRRYGVGVGTLTLSKVYVTNLTKLNVSPLSVIVEAIKREKAETGNRYVVRMMNGRLYVTPLRRNPILLAFGPQIRDGVLNSSMSGDFATALTIRVAKKKGTTKKADRVSISVRDTAAIARYGFIHRILEGAPEDTATDAYKQGRRILNELMVPDKTLTLELPGVSTVRRGDALRLNIPEAVEAGILEDQIVYVQEVAHSASAGNYQMSVTLRMDDPFVGMEPEEDARCTTARARGRTPPSFCRTERRKPKPQPSGATNRQDRRGPVMRDVQGYPIYE